MRRFLKNDQGNFARYAMLLAGAKTISLLLIMLLFQTVGMAQQSVVIDVSPRQLTTDDALQVTLTVSGRIVNLPELPPLEQFSLIGQRQVNQMSNMNGMVSQSIQFVYTLRPIETGTLTIGAFVVEVDDVVQETEPQTVQVAEGLQQLPAADEIIPDGMSSDDDFVMVTSVDNESPWIGEETVYTFWLFVAKDLVRGLDPIQFSTPLFEGFWNNNLFQAPRYSTVLDGREYIILQYDWYVYPTAPGRQTIGSAVAYVTKTSLLFTFALDEPIKVFGEDVEVDVRPLPRNAPADFTGAVGDFTVERKADMNAVDMNDDVTMNVTVRGSGNFAALPEPVWPDLDGWRVIDQGTSTITELTEAGVRGERTWTQSLIPTAPGAWEIPTLVYSFFNPETGRYETARAESFMVDVTGDAVRDDVTAASGEARPEIRPNRGAPDQLRQPQPLLQERPSYWALWFVPLVIVLGAEAVVRVRNRPKRPRKLKVFASQAERLDGVLSERFGVQFGGVTHARRRELLHQAGVDDGLIAQIDAFYRENEMKQFMGNDGDEIDAGVLIEAIREADNG